MTDKYIDPVRVVVMEHRNHGKPVSLDIGYGTNGLRFGIVDDTGHHVIDLPLNRAEILDEAIRIACAEYWAAEKEAGK